MCNKVCSARRRAEQKSPGFSSQQISSELYKIHIHHFGKRCSSFLLLSLLNYWRQLFMIRKVVQSETAKIHQTTLWKNSKNEYEWTGLHPMLPWQLSQAGVRWATERKLLYNVLKCFLHKKTWKKSVIKVGFCKETKFIYFGLFLQRITKCFKNRDKARSKTRSFTMQRRCPLQVPYDENHVFWVFNKYNKKKLHFCSSEYFSF